jgi:hypothetical protein
MARHPVLVSYAYMRLMRDEDMARLFACPHIDWLIDSGGFSALNAGHEITLDEYCAWLDKWKQHLHGYIALDRVGDPVVTERNLREMIARGLRPVPVHVWGDNEARMDELFGLSDWVALGGLRRPHSTHSSKSYVIAKHRWAKGRRVHWLGYTNGSMVRALRPYSCDSSNVVSGYRYGRLAVYHGDCRTWTEHSSLGTTRDIPFTTAELRWINRMGFHATELANPTARRRGSANNDPGLRRGMNNANKLGAITLNSFVRYSRDMLLRYGVRVFNAVTNVDIEALVAEIEREELRCSKEAST